MPLDLLALTGQLACILGVWRQGEKDRRGFLVMLYANAVTIVVGTLTQPRLYSYMVFGALMGVMNVIAWRKHARDS